MSERQKTLSARIIARGSRGWILEKFATRLSEELRFFGVEAVVSDDPSSHVDVNHWVEYADLRRTPQTINTLLVTHVDTRSKLAAVRWRAREMDAAVCLSRMTVRQLEAAGVDSGKLCWITPGHDGRLQPRKTVIGITSKVRADGAKREAVLIDLAQRMSLDEFRFEVFGPGWEKVGECLALAGAEVDYHPGTNDPTADYELMLSRIPSFDYYLYLGWDEGSMGVLDALAAGVATIVTPQGFHLDLRDGISHAVSGADDLADTLRGVRVEIRKRVEGVRDLTWSAYAQKHSQLWRAVGEGGDGGVAAFRRLAESTIDPFGPMLEYRLRPWRQVYLTHGFATARASFELAWYARSGREFSNTVAFRALRRLKRLGNRRG